MPKRQKSRVSLFLSICEKTVLEIEITSINSYYKSGYGLFKDARVSPQLDPSPHLGVRNKHEKNRENLNFPPSNYTTLCDVIHLENNIDIDVYLRNLQ